MNLTFFFVTKDVVKDSEEHPKSSRSFGASRPNFFMMA